MGQQPLLWPTLTGAKCCTEMHRHTSAHTVLNTLNYRLLQQRYAHSCCLMSPSCRIFFCHPATMHTMGNRPHQSLSYCEAMGICTVSILSYLCLYSQELTSSLVSCWIETPSISRPVHTLLWSTVFGLLKNDLICFWEWQGNCPHTQPWVCDP